VEILQGKRIALSGFNPDAGVRAAAAFDAELAFCRPIPAESAAPGSSLLENFDLLVAVFNAAKPWFEVAGRSSDIPLLISGSSADFPSALVHLARQGRDFVLDSAPPEELVLRAGVLLTRGSGNRRRGPRRPPLVVLADDEISVTALVKTVLDSDGITCETGSNGAEALDLARRLKPDVLLLDVNMPTIGGFEVLSEIKRDPATVGTRVVMLTAAEQESDIIRSFLLGASDYVVKPFNPMELLFRVRRLIRS